jgi:hypothetical protein
MQSSYSNIQQALIHPLGEAVPRNFPQSQDEWEADPSSKMNVAVSIVQIYMERNKVIRETGTNGTDGDYNGFTTAPPHRPIYHFVQGSLAPNNLILYPSSHSMAPKLDSIVIYTRWIHMSIVLQHVATFIMWLDLNTNPCVGVGAERLRGYSIQQHLV